MEREGWHSRCNLVPLRQPGAWLERHVLKGERLGFDSFPIVQNHWFLLIKPCSEPPRE